MAGTGKSGGADINVVPLIDIVLVLLIIFMVITPLIIKEMDLNLPEKAEDMPPPPPDQPPKEQVVMVMAADLNTYVNKTNVPRDMLGGHLKAIFSSRAYADRVLFFDAEDAANYGETVKVLDIARGAGVVKVGIITDRTNMAPPGATPTPGDPNAPQPAPTGGTVPGGH